MTQAQNKELFNLNKRMLKAQLPNNPICPYCNGIMLKDNSSPYALISIDHILAYSKGGSDELNNLLACCANCNTKKGNDPRSVMFKLDSPRILTDAEYASLNDFITISTRIIILEIIKESILKINYPEALRLARISQRSTTSKSFFTKLEQSLQKCLALSESKVRHDYSLKEVIVRLKAEKDKMCEIKEVTAPLNFSTYCLIG